ncbi:hypothetical protein PoB_003279100 [Plakobranchus ocellatus]|uniref:Uncharacterized protein n=1 Tax=Plakobranchus ocellatus TaxID=259542 RepID=A0AAV4AI43_9GAST|nr:hypothetical protein PoB_003279100 [Plakobranchus ocellatus]
MSSESNGWSKHRMTRSRVLVVLGLRHSQKVCLCFSGCIYSRRVLRDLTILLELCPGSNGRLCWSRLGLKRLTSRLVAICPTRCTRH